MKPSRRPSPLSRKRVKLGRGSARSSGVGARARSRPGTRTPPDSGAQAVIAGPVAPIAQPGLFRLPCSTTSRRLRRTNGINGEGRFAHARRAADTCRQLVYISPRATDAAAPHEGRANRRAGGQSGALGNRGRKFLAQIEPFTPYPPRGADGADRLARAEGLVRRRLSRRVWR